MYITTTHTHSPFHLRSPSPVPSHSLHPSPEVTTSWILPPRIAWSVFKCYTNRVIHRSSVQQMLCFPSFPFIIVCWDSYVVTSSYNSFIVTVVWYSVGEDATGLPMLLPSIWIVSSCDSYETCPNYAAVNGFVSVFLYPYVCVSLGYISRSGMTGS